MLRNILAGHSAVGETRPTLDSRIRLDTGLWAVQRPGCCSTWKEGRAGTGRPATDRWSSNMFPPGKVSLSRNLEDTAGTRSDVTNVDRNAKHGCLRSCQRGIGRRLLKPTPMGKDILPSKARAAPPWRRRRSKT